MTPNPDRISTPPQRRKIGFAVGAVLAGVAFFAVNLLAVRDEPFVPPSQFYFNASFSARLALARAETSDILVFGNSRMRSGLSPRVLNETLDAAAARSERPIRVQMLADAGGFPSFYDAAFDLALDGRPAPRAVIVGISPRDLDEGDRRKREPAADLLQSSGYRLARLPYNRFFAGLETAFVDRFAATLPGLYERERVVGAFIPAAVSQWIYVDIASSRVGQVLQLWMRRFLGQADGAFPASAAAWAERAVLWQRRAAGLGGLALDPTRQGVDAFGGEAMVPPEDATQRTARIANVARIVAQAQAQGAARVCREALEGTAMAALIDRIVAQGIAVYLVQPPGLYLEPCEMRAIEDGRFGRAVAALMVRHGDKVRFLDLMGDAGRDIRDPNYFGDADHMTGEGAERVGRIVGAWLAPMLRPLGRL
jgi:hypothetical protein